MITLHTEIKRDFMAVLHPTECTVTEEAGGDYSLSMTHPVDDEDIWTMIRCDRIIQVPVPHHLIPGVEVEEVTYYKVNDNLTSTTLWKSLPRTETTEVQNPGKPIPPAFSQTGTYIEGKDRVSVRVGNFYNIYVCLQTQSGDPEVLGYPTPRNPRTSEGTFWKFEYTIAVSETEATVTEQTSRIPGKELVQLPGGHTPIIKIRDKNKYYMRVKTNFGGKNYEGYIKISDCEKIGGDAPGEGGIWEMTSDDMVYSAPNANSEVLETIAEGERYTLIAHHDSRWNHGTAQETGTEGYFSVIRSTEITNGADGIEPDDPVTFGERHITAQFFRIYSVAVSSDNTVQVEARHVSYDFEGETLTSCSMYEASPELAVDSLTESVFDTQDAREIITDFTDADGILITADYSYKNGIVALLDPSDGLAFKLKAKVMRDNDDFYLLRNTPAAPVYQITYGHNLLGVEWTEDYDGLVTRIFPRAKDTGGNKPLWLEPNVEGYNKGCVDSPYLFAYPRIRYEVLEVDGQVDKRPPSEPGAPLKPKYTAETLREEMVKKAKERFEKDECDLPNTSVHVEFLKLGDTEEYKQYRGAEQLALYDWVRVYHPQIGMDFSLQVIGYTWDAIKERYESIDIGRPYAQAGSGRRIASWEIGRQAVGLASLTQELKDKLGV